MKTNESIVDYSQENYTKKILSNNISFSEANKLMSSIDGEELDLLWRTNWNNFQVE